MNHCFSKKNAVMASICAAGVALSGCATLVSGTHQVIDVQAIDAKTHNIVPDAKCTLTDTKSVIYPVSGNPGNVKVSREYGGLKANCVAPGYLQSGVGTGQSFNAWTLADVIFWPSVFVDAGTGAAKKYPSHITVLMEKNPPLKHLKKHAKKLTKKHTTQQ